MHQPAMSPPRLIACAVDVAPDADPTIAEHIVDAAAAWAAPFGATLVLLHASPPPPPLPAMHTGSEAAVEAFAGVWKAQHQHVADALARLAARATARGVTTTTRVVTEPGRLPDLLAQAALDVGAQLLVVGSRSRRGLAHRLLGSVAERTAHLSHVPVLLLPPD